MPYARSAISKCRPYWLLLAPRLRGTAAPHPLQGPGDADQALGKIGIDAPVAHSVGMGKRITSHHRTNPEMRAWNFARADILRCLEGSPERSTERTPCTGIDPGTRRTSTLNAPR